MKNKTSYFGILLLLHWFLSVYFRKRKRYRGKQSTPTTTQQNIPQSTPTTTQQNNKYKQETIREISLIHLFVMLSI